MKKGIITAGVLATIACTITVYCRAIESETVSEDINTAQSLSGQQVKSVTEGAKGKALVVLRSRNQWCGRLFRSQPSCRQW